jgi:hypothetical protein
MQSSLTAKKEQMLKNSMREAPEPKISSKKMDLEEQSCLKNTIIIVVIITLPKSLI